MPIDLLAVLRELRKPRARKRASSTTTHRRGLSLEPLESRMLLDAYGLGWANAPDLTISFARDGTDVAGYESSLFAEMDAITHQTNRWQQTIVRSFETWAKHLDADVTVVADNGDPFGTTGLTQGDPRFGDVRIGAVPMSSAALGISIPHNELICGTWAADILFNSNVNLGNLDNLYSVALHEAGHSYGLGHSSNPNSPMFSHRRDSQISAYRVSAEAKPTAQDIATLESLYGLPEPIGETGDEEPDDRLDGANPLVVSANFDYSIRYYATGRIADTEDVDYFQLDRIDSAFEHFKHLSVTVRSMSPDGAIPQATILNHEGYEVESTILANGNGLFTIEAQEADPRQSHFIRIDAGAVDGTFSHTAYDLTATFGSASTILETAAEDSLDHERPAVAEAFVVHSSALFHFAFTVESDADDPGIVVTANVLDTSGDTVFRVAARGGETRSANTVLLTPGVYRIEVSTQGVDGSEIPELNYRLMYSSMSLPIGPVLHDPTTDPWLPNESLGCVIDPVVDTYYPYYGSYYPYSYYYGSYSPYYYGSYYGSYSSSYSSSYSFYYSSSSYSYYYGSYCSCRGSSSYIPSN